MTIRQHRENATARIEATHQEILYERRDHMPRIQRQNRRHDVDPVRRDQRKYDIPECLVCVLIIRSINAAILDCSLDSDNGEID